MTVPLQVALRLTRHNRNSIAALLAALERDLPSGVADLVLATSPRDADGAGLAIYSFMTAQATAVARGRRSSPRALNPSTRGRETSSSP